MNYDFSQLNDKEFEAFSADLLGEHLGQRIERFKPGRDEGVDGRYYSDRNKEIILQCKHYLKSGYKNLIAKLKGEEKNKVQKLKPEKYIFITSLPLSRNNKSEIKEIFSPYILREDDIYGKDDLNQLLSKHKNIEEQYFKLWISSTNVLSRIINNAIKGRSEFEIEQIQEKSKNFIQTEAYSEAINILKSNHVLIISGEPGIGKTTLAENICLQFASQEFEFISIENSLNEAENVYAKGKKQIFYFDDFLGSNYFEAIENKKDSHIVKFIERVKSDKSKLFVLTSRTNILNSGVVHSPIFSNKNIRRDEHILTIQSLTETDRAWILYNHIWFSELTEEFIDEIYKDRRYALISNHKNYNPRLIEFITDSKRINLPAASNYWEHIQNTLNNPKDIWSNCFNVQNNSYVRNLVLLVVFNGGTINEPDLHKSFTQLVKVEGSSNPSHTEKGFIPTAELATKSFLKRQHKHHQKATFYTLFNPSISDFLIGEYQEDSEKLSSLFLSLGTIQSLKNLVSMEREKIISPENLIRIKEIIFSDIKKGNKDQDYQILLSKILYKDKGKRKDIERIIQKIIDHPLQINQISDFIFFLREYSKNLSFNNYQFIITAIGKKTLDGFEIQDLAAFIDEHLISNSKLESILEESLDEFIYDELTSRRSDIDLSYLISFEGSESGEVYPVYDSLDIENELTEIAREIFEEFSFESISRLDVNPEFIAGRIDIDGMVDDYLSSQIDSTIEDYTQMEASSESDIDDIFERS